MKKKIFSTFFFIILLLTIILAGLIIWPYIGYMIFALLIAYALKPLYHLVVKWVGKPWLASSIMLLIVIIVILIPSAMLFSKLLGQSYDALSSINDASLDNFSMKISSMLGVNVDLSYYVYESVGKLKDYIINESINLLTSIIDVVIGVIIMFFILFYFFKDGDRIIASINSVLPLRPKHRDVLMGEIELVTNAVVYGQLVTAIIQGSLAGLGFFIFGIPNAIFWGFIMILLSFLPIIGAFIVYIPAGIIEILGGNYFAGFGVIIYGVVLVSQIDNIIRPLIISKKSRLNAAVVFIGVIGGIKLFGFIGFVLGPLILGLLQVLLRTFKEDFKPSSELEEVRKKPENYFVIRLRERPPDQHRRFIKKRRS